MDVGDIEENVSVNKKALSKRTREDPLVKGNAVFTKVVKNSKVGTLKKIVNKKYCATNMEAQVSAFLERHRVRRPQPFTHTTLQPKGSYYIGEDFIHFFMTHYCNAVRKGCKFAITESPEKYGPLRVDIDLKASLEMGLTRQYTYDTVKKIIGMYQELIRTSVAEQEDETPAEKNKRLRCILLEKPTPRVESGVVKDGFHLHFPFFVCEAWLQDDFRNKVMAQMKTTTLWGGKYINPLDKIVDDGIARKNWLMYGSAKALDIQPFMVSKIYDHDLKEMKLEVCFHDEVHGKKSSVQYYLPQLLSVRGYREITPLNQETEARRSTFVKKRKNIAIHKKRTQEEALADIILIKNAEFMDMLSEDRADSYDDWMNVGWALFCIGQGSDEALELWNEFSKRSPKFKEGECEEKWSTMRMGNYTMGSIRQWAKHDNLDRYLEWKKYDINTHIDDSLSDKPNEWDVANVVHCMFADRFKCADAKKDIWYEYKNHRWQSMDDGVPMKLLLVNEVIKRYRDKIGELNSKLKEQESEQETKKMKKCIDIISHLKTCAFQDKVIKMCKILFYDGLFMKKLDENKILWGCENGIIDLERNIFRDGVPDDYVSYSCGLTYPTNISNNDDEVYDLNDFFKKVFPNERVRNYFLDNVAIAMEGGNINKTFNIGTGDGDNAKTITYALVEQTFGEYCIKFPRELFILSRGNASSGARPELSRVRGKRMGIVQEIAKTETLNIGQLKELTGNDSFFARGLYEKGTDIKPMLTVFSQMNEPPRVPGHDEATWNRIRIVDFEAKFVKDKDLDKWPVPPTEKEQFEMKRFHADVTFSKRLQDLSPALLWFLVERRKVLKSTGLYEPPEVKVSTSKYKQQNDVYMQFVQAVLTKAEVPKGQKAPFLKSSIAHQEFQGWTIENYSSYSKEKINRVTFIHELSKKLGECVQQGREKGWFGWEIVQEQPSQEDQQQQLQTILEKK